MLAILPYPEYVSTLFSSPSHPARKFRWLDVHRSLDPAAHHHHHYHLHPNTGDTLHDDHRQSAGSLIRYRDPSDRGSTDDVAGLPCVSSQSTTGAGYLVSWGHGFTGKLGPFEEWWLSARLAIDRKMLLVNILVIPGLMRWRLSSSVLLFVVL